MTAIASTNETLETKKTRRTFLYVWLATFVLLFWGHYGLTPVTDFVADDWCYMGANVHQTPQEIIITTARDYYRPINIMVNRLLFHYPGDFPLFFSVLRVVMHGLILAAYLVLLRSIFRDDRALWIGGIFYALVPNTHEMFYWANMVALLYYPFAMLASMALWISWCRNPGPGRLILSVLGYIAGILTYENCVTLCWMYPLAGILLAARKRVWFSLIFVFLAVVYAAYRFTHGFGWGVAAVHGGGYFGEGQGFDLVGSLQSIRSVFSWWIGGLGAESFLGGFNSFALLKPKVQVLFVAISLMCLWGVWRCAKRSWPCLVAGKDEGRRIIQGGAFGLAWVVLAYAPHLLFAPASRHNIMPAFGVGMILVAVLLHFRPRISIGSIGALALVCLIANAGNGLAWREAGMFCRNLYRHLIRTQPEWSQKNLVVFDTESLRERQTPGVLAKRRDDMQTWALYRNAILMRGFVGTGMMNLCMKNPPRGIQDTECEVSRQGAVVNWHDRYNPAAPHQTPLGDVYWINCLAAAQTPAD